MIFPPTTDGQALGLGGAPLGNLFATIPEPRAAALLAHVINDGCRTFDTAPHYGNGRSEHRIGEALRTARLARDSFVLSSKSGRLLRADAATARDQNAYVDVMPFSQPSTTATKARCAVLKTACSASGWLVSTSSTFTILTWPRTARSNRRSCMT